MAGRTTSIEGRFVNPDPFPFTRRKVGVLVIGLMAGCAAPRLVQIPQPAGPAPFVLSPPSLGRLVVFTEEISPGNDEDVSWSHESYTVLDSSGRLLKRIGNDSGEEVVPLGAGRYFVRAKASGNRVVAIVFQVVAGRTTEVHLEGKWTPEESRASETLVFGLDGSPAGYRCVPETAPSDSGRKP
jgi:hypothetical protein